MGVSNPGGLARVAKGETVDPFSVDFGASLGNGGIVSSAIIGGEELGITDIHILDLGRLGVLEAEANSGAKVVVKSESLTGVVPDIHVVVSLGKSTGGQEGEQDD